MFSVENLSRHVQGTVHGDALLSIQALKSLEYAQATDISFVNGEKYLAQAQASNAGALIVPKTLVDALQGQCTLIEVESPYLAFALLTHVFAKKTQFSGVSPDAIIHESAKIGENATISPGVVIAADVVIGANATIYPNVFIDTNVSIGQFAYIESNVSILEGTEIGDHVRIHANTSIGGEGFGFAPYQGQWHRIVQLGKVRIGHQVRIGSNCSIDRGALDDTVIDDGVIIDNLVQIAHNVQIGQHTAIAAATAIAGSTTIGAHCILGGACGIAGHLTIADHVQLTGMSMITKSVHQPGTYSSGTGQFESGIWRRAVIGLRQLSEVPIQSLVKQIKQLQHRLDVLETIQPLRKNIDHEPE